MDKLPLTLTQQRPWVTLQLSLRIPSILFPLTMSLFVLPVDGRSLKKSAGHPLQQLQPWAAAPYIG
jgi:hypothetical protein